MLGLFIVGELSSFGTPVGEVFVGTVPFVAPVELFSVVPPAADVFVPAPPIVLLPLIVLSGTSDPYVV
jgi:hypothetical protein